MNSWPVHPPRPPSFVDFVALVMTSHYFLPSSRWTPVTITTVATRHCHFDVNISVHLLMEPFAFGGQHFHCVMTQFHLYFWSSLLKRVTFSFSISFCPPLSLSHIVLRSPGERMLKWRHVIAVPYQWLTEACVPWPVTTLSLFLLLGQLAARCSITSVLLTPTPRKNPQPMKSFTRGSAARIPVTLQYKALTSG